MFNRITYTDKYNDFEASGAPTVNDDSGVGFEEGSFYYDSVGGNLYVCVDPTSGAAIWETINATGGIPNNSYPGLPFIETFAIQDQGYGIQSQTVRGLWTRNFVREAGKVGINRMRTPNTANARVTLRNQSGTDAFLLDDNITELKWYIKPPDEAVLATDWYEIILGFCTNGNPHQGIGTANSHICWRLNIDEYGTNNWQALASTPLGSIVKPTTVSAQPTGLEPWSVFSIIIYGGTAFVGNKRIEFWYEDEAGTTLFKAAEITENELTTAGITDIFDGSAEFGFTLSMSDDGSTTVSRDMLVDAVFFDKRTS